MYDVAIAGAGFAGCLVAIQLARRGFKVVVFERGKQIGQETRSGGLCSIEWWRSVGETSCPAFVSKVERCQEVVFSCAGVLKRERSAEGVYAFEREDLDAFLYRKLDEFGVELREGYNVESFVEDPKGVCYFRSAGRHTRACAGIIATGADEQVLVGTGLVDNRTCREVRLACHETLLLDSGPNGNRPCYAVFFCNLPVPVKGSGYLLRLGRKIHLVICVTLPPSSLVDWSFKPRELIARIRENPEIASYLAGARPLTWKTRLVGTDPPVRRPAFGERILLVGDAAMPLGGTPPWGSGIKWAALTAREAAAVLSKVLPTPTRLSLRAYAEKITPIMQKAARSAKKAHLNARIAGALAGILGRILG